MLEKIQYFFCRAYTAYLRAVLDPTASAAIETDAQVYCDVCGFAYGRQSVARLFSEMPEFRSIVYYRIKNRYRFPAKWIWKGMPTLFLNSPNISPGLMIRHGFSTVINATTERNVMVYQQVTLGAGRNGTPTLLEGATVCCGAIVIGGVTVGRNATVGANALVVKDVPDNAIVAGNPAKIIGYNSAGENAGRP